MYEPISSGSFKSDRGEELSYEMALLDESHLSLAMDLQQRIVDEINDPIFYDPVILDNMKKRFRAEGRIIGTFIRRRLVALLVMHFPSRVEDNFGKDIDLPPHELKRVAHLASMLVHPDYRGNALAYRMNMVALPLLRRMRFCHVCSTVFPGNYPNIVTMFKTGLVIRALKDKYGGKQRYIFYQHLERPYSEVVRGAKASASEVPIDDFCKQQQLLGEGYCACGLNRCGDVPALVWGHME